MHSSKNPLERVGLMVKTYKKVFRLGKYTCVLFSKPSKLFDTITW